ncbi:MAG: NADPH-dependent 7-cyano-7-deazaguanine reductase QueF [Porticoccaceae bacterium]
MADKPLLLGAATEYPDHYSPEVLHPIPRREGREALGISPEPPFFGVDLWTGYELSWLDLKGKPLVAVAEIAIPCDSVNLVESKSLKLYLNSLNQERYRTPQDVVALLEKDIADCVGGPVQVDIHMGDSYRHRGVAAFPGICLDDLPIEVDSYSPDPTLLDFGEKLGQVTESLYSHLLKTNCPVTGQPDWASILIRYTGRPIDREGLLRYLISFRNHQDFHEQCVERIFMEINDLCAPEHLEVYARYTRRGGLDINPFRSSSKMNAPSLRLARQ